MTPKGDAEEVRWTIASLAESTATVEIGDRTAKVSRALLPPAAREGDVLRVTIDAGATREALAASEAQLAEAPRDGGSGDIAL